MDTVAPILGMSMLASGFLLLLFCLGGLARTYWRRSGINVNRGTTTSPGAVDSSARDTSP